MYALQLGLTMLKGEESQALMVQVWIRQLSHTTQMAPRALWMRSEQCASGTFKSSWMLFTVLGSISHRAPAVLLPLTTGHLILTAMLVNTETSTATSPTTVTT